MINLVFEFKLPKDFDLEKFTQSSIEISKISGVEINYVSTNLTEQYLKATVFFKERFQKISDELSKVTSQKEQPDITPLEKHTYQQIESANLAEIHALEKPLVFKIEKGEKVVLVREDTQFKPESTEFEMLEFYLKNNIVDLFWKLLGKDFSSSTLTIRIEEG